MGKNNRSARAFICRSLQNNWELEQRRRQRQRRKKKKKKKKPRRLPTCVLNFGTFLRVLDNRPTWIDRNSRSVCGEHEYTTVIFSFSSLARAPSLQFWFLGRSPFLYKLNNKLKKSRSSTNEMKLYFQATFLITVIMTPFKLCRIRDWITYHFQRAL